MEPSKIAPDPSAGLLRGQLFLARFTYLKDTFGVPAIERALTALGEEDRRLLRGVERDLWYPFLTFVRLDEAIAAVIAPHDPDLYERLGAASAVHRTEWLRAHAHLMSVHGFLARAAEEHHRFHSFGLAEYRRTGFESGELLYRDYPVSHVVFCRSSLGFLREAVALVSGTTATGSEVDCQCRGGGVCRFVLQWGDAATPA